MSNTFEFAERFGYNPPILFGNDSASEGVYDGAINFQELADYLNSCGRFWFDYKDYISKKEVYTQGLEGVVGVSIVNNPLIIRTKNEEREIAIKGEFNKKQGRIAVRQGKLFFSFKITKDKEIEYKQKIRYEFSNETAIKLITNNYHDHLALSTYINIEENSEVKELIKKKFKQVFIYAENDIGLLKWLYQQAPQFVLQDRRDDRLINDLMKLISYDKDGWLSWFRDSTTEIYNLLTGFNDITKLYNYFNDNPEKVIETYDVLDRNSQQEFAKLLDAISIPLTKNIERVSDAKFIIGSDYTLDSNLLLEDNQKAIRLNHYELKPTIMDEFLIEIGIEGTQFKAPVNKQTQFHPLDIVTMVDQVSGEEKIVTAIHVKALSDKKEWDQVESETVIVVSIIAILVSAGTLAGGATGLVAVIAVVELAVSSLDLLKELLSGSGKEHSGSIKWFIDNWDAVSGTHGLISISSALKSGIIKHGPKVLARIKNLPNSPRILNLRNYIGELITTIRIEFYFASRLGLTYCAVLPFKTVVKLLGLGGEKIATNMKKFGLSIIEPIEGNKDIKALIYFGTKIEEGNIKDIKALLKSIFPFGAKNKDVIKRLNELAEIARKANLRRLTLIKWADKFDNSFIRHLDGELGLETIKLKSGLLVNQYITIGQGGHKWSKNIRLKEGTFKIPNPPLDDLPYKANIEVKYRNKYLPKMETTSIFPDNWDLKRIQEEIAYVYENTVAKGTEVFNNSRKFDKYRYYSSDGSFKIIIEVDEAKNIMNAYPHLN